MRLGKPGDAVSTSGSVMRQIINEQLQISESNPIKARYYDYDRFTYPWHFHSQYEIIYVKKSCGRCFVGDCIERFSEGDVVLFGPSLPHYMRSDDAYHGDNPRLRVQGTIIQFEENFMQYSFDHYPQFHQIRVLLKEARRGVVFHTADASPVRDMVSAFPELKGFGQITGLLDLLQALAVSVPRRMLASPCYYEKFPTAGNKRIDKIISFINSNYTRSLKLDEIAEMANMNSSAFCRFFKDATEKTFLQYVADMRIGYACKLLTIGDMEVSQIAVECGFDSIPHFNRTLLQRTAALRPFADIRYGRHTLLCRYPGTSGRKPVADYGIRILLLRHGIQDFAGAFPPVDGRRIRRCSEYGNRLPERYLQRCGGIRADDHPL
jgi:AraC-like DNA-binding protein